MSKNTKNMMREVMLLGWQFIKKNGYGKREALRVAWLNIKLTRQMKSRIVRFWFQKVDGSIREAFGCLIEKVIPQTNGSRKPNDTVQTYFDCEKNEWRCYKRANLLRMA